MRRDRSIGCVDTTGGQDGMERAGTDSAKFDMHSILATISDFFSCYLPDLGADRQV